MDMTLFFGDCGEEAAQFLAMWILTHTMAAQGSGVKKKHGERQELGGPRFVPCLHWKWNHCLCILSFKQHFKVCKWTT